MRTAVYLAAMKAGAKDARMVAEKVETWVVYLAATKVVCSVEMMVEVKVDLKAVH